MKKLHEMVQRSSCWNKAEMHELVFVLLGRDKAAPATIRFWMQERVRLGLNSTTDAQLDEADNLAFNMEQLRDTLRGGLENGSR